MTDPLRRASAAAATLLERREKDGLYRWQPHAKQTPFLQSRAPEAWMIAANRSGKSDALAAIVASHARFGEPNPRAAYAAGGRIAIYDRAVAIWCISLTYSLGKESFQPKLFDSPGAPPSPNPPFIPAWEVQRWNETRQCLELKNGSVMWFKSADQKAKTFQAAERDLIAFDEVPPKTIYDECTIRVPSGARRLMVRGAATLLPPEGMIGGVSWLYSEKCQPWLEGKLPDVELFGAAIYDNPHIPKDEIQRLERRYPPGSLMYRIRLLGEWLPGVAGALAYPAFDRRIHVDGNLSAKDRQFRTPLIWNIDWNVEPMGTTVFQRVGEQYVGLDEITLERGNVPDAAQEFRRRYPTHGAELWIHGDATGGWRSNQSAKSNFTVLQECLKGLPYPVRILVPQVNPPEPDRVNAVNAALRGPYGGQNRVRLSGEMTETTADFEQVLLDRSGKIRKTSNRGDPYIRRTSWTDGIGYMVVYHDPVTFRPAKRIRRLRAPGYGWRR